MLPQEFKPGFEKMVSIFNPYRWNEDSEDVYFNIFCDWPAEEWDQVVSAALRDLDKMPKPKDLFNIRDGIRGARDTTKPNERAVDDCSACDGGRINFLIVNPHNGQVYERQCACDRCEAGEYVLEQMAMVNKRARRKGDAFDLRWSSIKQRYGIEEEAVNGRAYTPETEAKLLGISQTTNTRVTRSRFGNPEHKSPRQAQTTSLAGALPF